MKQSKWGCIRTLNTYSKASKMLFSKSFKYSANLLYLKLNYIQISQVNEKNLNLSRSTTESQSYFPLVTPILKTQNLNCLK